jgi:hypothetical protein
MKSSGPLERGGASKTSRGRVAPGAMDFAWPPTVEDLDGCGIVDLADDAAAPNDRVFGRLADGVKPVAGPLPSVPRLPQAPRPPLSVSRPAGARPRHWGVERPDVSFPFRADADDSPAETSASGETWRAIVAVAAGLSLAVLSYAQFRGLRSDATALVAAVTQAATPPSSREAEITIEIPAMVADAVRQASPSESRKADPESRHGSAVTATPVREVLTQLATDVMQEIRPTESVGVLAQAEPAEARTLADPVAAPTAQPALLRDDEQPGEPAAVAVTAAHADPAPGDEDHIRAALTRWRTAYSELDAPAAREIWPSVDATALARAFQALKSQDLRFDRCDLTVTGGTAQAACRGRAVYVPRVGNQSPKATPREWRFELKKLDERWTIASARAS